MAVRAARVGCAFAAAQNGTAAAGGAIVPALQISPARPEDATEVAALHVSSWQVAYAGIVPAEHLAQLSVCARVTLWREAILRGSPPLYLAREEIRAGDSQPAPGEHPRGSRAVGFVSFGKCRDAGVPDTWGEIWALYVLPSRWSHGVGQALLRHACELLRQERFQQVSLWVLAENERALRFYRRAGLVPDAGAAQTIELGGKTLLELRYRAELR
jgi:ribosomal protein S18 acetylase RimI-like enzyme